MEPKASYRRPGHYQGPGPRNRRSRENIARLIRVLGEIGVHFSAGPSAAAPAAIWREAQELAAALRPNWPIDA